MKKLKLLIIPFILVLFILGTNSCVKDSFDFDRLSGEIHYEPSLAAPIAYSNLTMIDGLNAYDSVGRVQVNKDGFLSLFYFEHIESDTVSSLMDIGNQHVTSLTPAAGVDFTGFDNSGDVLTINRSVDFPFDLFNPEAELDSMWLDMGTLNLIATSTYEHGIELTITLPTFTKDGDPFSKTLNLLPYGSTASSTDNSMIGYHIDLTQTALGYNEVPVEIQIRFVHSGGNNTGQLTLDVDLFNPDHEAMFGYFGYNTLIYESGKIDLDLFDPSDGWDLEDFWFEDPKFKVFYNNSYGIPTNFYFDSVTAFSSYYQQDYDILDYNAGLPMDSLAPHYMSYPTVFGSSVDDSLILDKDNSNISYVIQQRPAWIKFIAHAHTNPDGNIAGNNFVWDNSKYLADIEVELPLWGYIDRFHGADTMDFNMEEEFEDPGVIERLLVRINIDNGLPIFVESQAYFMNENYMIIDSVIQADDIRLIESATIDNDGQVISKTNKTIDLEITGERLEKIMETKFLLYKASSSTTNASNDEFIKIYPDYEVNFNVAIEADLDINVNLDTLNND
ncbi:MAG: hypothetical protein U9N51_12355 [Bacteroidota bacterium]|nr:hypothetical protein [Bacteroidota bacterium]